VLRHNTIKLREDLRRELELHLGKLEDQFHARTLAQIFIEERIYKRIETCESWEEIIATVRKGLEEHVDRLRRETITEEDIEALLKIPIRRISLFDINKSREELARILERIAEVEANLARLTAYTIDFITALKEKYGPLYPRRTRIREMAEVNVREIALTNVKVTLDRGSGYLGTSIRQGETITCTEYDKIVVLKTDGSYKVMNIPDKLYVGPVCAVFKLNKQQVYSVVYRDKKTKTCYAKRFRIDRFILDKEYRCCPKGAKIEKFFDRVGVVLRCEFEPAPRQKVATASLSSGDISKLLRSTGTAGPSRCGTRPAGSMPRGW